MIAQKKNSLMFRALKLKKIKISTLLQKMKKSQTFRSLGSEMFNLKSQEDYLYDKLILLCLLHSLTL